jgi:hypothetical protein
LVLDEVCAALTLTPPSSEQELDAALEALVNQAVINVGPPCDQTAADCAETLLGGL